MKPIDYTWEHFVHEYSSPGLLTSAINSFFGLKNRYFFAEYILNN